MKHQHWRGFPGIFDQSALRGGDALDASIRTRIKECALLVPMISASTNARSGVYFRPEWWLAMDGSKYCYFGNCSSPNFPHRPGSRSRPSLFGANFQR